MSKMQISRLGEDTNGNVTACSTALLNQRPFRPKLKIATEPQNACHPLSRQRVGRLHDGEELGNGFALLARTEGGSLATAVASRRWPRHESAIGFICAPEAPIPWRQMMRWGAA